LGFFSFGAALVLAGCSNDPPTSTTSAPVPGDVGPRADPSDAPETKSPSGLPAMKKAGGSDAKPAGSGDPEMMNPDTFVPKAWCMLPKLSICSTYGSKYERLGSVKQFCSALGGEEVASCPEEGKVVRCMTPANVITAYYSVGAKPYTKETGEAKCLEKNWMVLP
jgi:hypothetical protein